MAETIKKLRVFLASPGDMEPERRAAKECVDEWNAINSDRSGWFVDLMGWEDTLPQRGRPQHLINSEVERCALFVGMLWERWGSPTGSAESGFEEEFELANRLYDEKAAPEIALFFKQLSRTTDDAGPQLSQVLQFRQRVMEEKKLLYKELDADLSKWTPLFRQTIHRLINDLIDRLDKQEPQETSEAPQQRLEASDSLNLQRLSLVKRIAAQIEATGTEPSSAQIARLRLASIRWHRPGLSDTFLDVHDANVLYNNRASLGLDDLEIRGAVESSLALYTSEVAPLWGWVFPYPEMLGSVQFRAAFLRDTDACIGGLRALGDAQIALSTGLRESLADTFPTAASRIRNAALRYLSVTGTTEDLPLIESEIAGSDYATASEAIAAAVAVRARQSTEQALTFILSSELEPPSNKLVSRLLDQMNTLGLSEQRSGLAHKSASVRLACSKSLRAAKELTLEETRTLRADPSAAVRKEAVLAAVELGETISLSDAERIIRGSGRPLGLGAFNALASYSRLGEDEFAEARYELLSRAPREVLEAEMTDLYSPAEVAYEHYYLKFFREEASRLRADVDDRFTSHYQRARQAFLDRFGSAAAESILSKFSELQEFRVGQMMRAALNVLAQKGNAGDLRRFRLELTDHSLALNQDDLNYFARFGEWTDIPLLARARTDGRIGLLSSDDEEIESSRAETIYRIGRNNFDGLLGDALPSGILASVIDSAEKTKFSILSDDRVFRLLNNETPAVRKATAKKAARSFRKSRLASLLQRYIGQERYFYNVVYWLDAAVACPRDVLAALTSQSVR